MNISFDDHAEETPQDPVGGVLRHLFAHDHKKALTALTSNSLWTHADKKVIWHTLFHTAPAEVLVRLCQEKNWSDGEKYWSAVPDFLRSFYIPGIVELLRAPSTNAQQWITHARNSFASHAFNDACFFLNVSQAKGAPLSTTDMLEDISSLVFRYTAVLWLKSQDPTWIDAPQRRGLKTWLFANAQHMDEFSRAWDEEMEQHRENHSYHSASATETFNQLDACVQRQWLAHHTPAGTAVPRIRKV